MSSTLILTEVAALKSSTARRGRRLSSAAAPACASSMAGPSLKRRSRKMECNRFDRHSSGSAHGGTTCRSAYAVHQRA